MVLKFLHQTYLSLVLNRLMRRTIFANAESVVSPDELDGKFHQRGHTDGRLHIIGEDKERPHRGDDSAVQSHTDAKAGHRQLRHSCLKETSGEIAFLNNVCVGEKTVRLVRITQIGRRADHVLHIFRQHRQAGR